MKHLILPGILVATLLADGTTSGADDFSLLLEEAQELATKSKLTLDYSPSTISVLRERDFTRLGLTTVHDALGLFAGTETTVNNMGWNEVTIRGVRNSNAFGFDKVKILIDGVDVTNAIYGSVHYYLDFPIGLVERIEVLRGAGSATYGSGAFAGAVNIVTKIKGAGEPGAFLYLDTLTGKKGGANYRFREGAWNVGVDGYVQSGDYEGEVPPDKRGYRGGTSFEDYRGAGLGLNLENGDFRWYSRFKTSTHGNYAGEDERAEPDNDPGEQEDVYLFTDLSYKHTFANGHHLMATGGYRKYRLSYDFTERDAAATLDDIRNYARNLARSVLTDYYGFVNDADADKALIDGYRAQSQALGETLLAPYATASRFLGWESEEETFYADLSYHVPLEKADLVFGLAHRATRNLDNSFFRNYYDPEKNYEIADAMEEDLAAMLAARADQIVPGDAANFETLFFGAMNEMDYAAYQMGRKLTWEDGYLGSDAETVNSAVYFQGRARLAPRWEGAFNARYDHWKKFDDTASNNLGVVYLADDANTWKATYGTAYRVPSWMEYYSSPVTGRLGNEDLKPEKIETVELFWTHNAQGSYRHRIGVFHSTLRDVIDYAIDCGDLEDGEEGVVPCYEDYAHTYTNYDKRETRGVEVEVTQKLGSQHELMANATYQKTKGYGYQPYYHHPFEEDAPFADTPDFLANLVYRFQPVFDLIFTSHLEYVGEKRQNSDQDSEDRYPGDPVIDPFWGLHQSVTYKFDSALSTTFGVRNLLDEPQYLPSRWGRRQGDVVGIPRPGRYVHASLTAKF